MSRKDDEYRKKQKNWDAVRDEFQDELWKKAEIINKFDVKSIKQTNITLILEDSEGTTRKFKLISVIGSGGVLGEPLSIQKDYIEKLIKKYKTVYPFISKINFYEKPYFPYSKDEMDVKFSPLFILIHNTAYLKNQIDPYNVEMAGFLVNYIPRRGIYLEGVTKSVAGTISVIENIMKKENESYSRKNHLLNWLYFIISRDSTSLKATICNMQRKLMLNFSEYYKSLSEEKK